MGLMLPGVHLAPPDVMGLVALFAFAAALAMMGVVWAIVHRLLHPPRKTYAVALARGLPTHPEGTMPQGGTELVLTLVDGLETPAFLVNGAKADGPTVVVVHGFGDSRYGALTWAPLLVEYAREVLVYDLRGHGDNAARRAQIVVGDTRDLLRVLEEWDAPNGVVLFGYSMGAGIAIAAAAHSNSPPSGRGQGEGEGRGVVADRNQQARSVMSGASPPPPRQASAPPPEGEGAADRIVFPHVRGVIADGPYRRWDEPIVRHIRARRWPAQPFTFLAGLVLRVMSPGLGFDRVRDAGKLRCPLLVLHGTEDWLCPVESARAIAAAAPRGELVEVEGGGHLDLAAVDADGYRDALRRFFERIEHDAASGTGRADRPHAAESGGVAR